MRRKGAMSDPLPTEVNPTAKPTIAPQITVRVFARDTIHRGVSGNLEYSVRTIKRTATVTNT
jgi:hypothetical protein